MDFDILCALKGYSTESITSLKYDDLPSLLDYHKYYLKEADKNGDSYQYVISGINALQEQYKSYYSDNYQYCILPIKSDPTMVDSDDDGYLDSILNENILLKENNPNGYIDVVYPKPLYSNVKKYQLKTDYISVDGYNWGTASSYGGFQNAFYSEDNNKDYYDEIGEFIANRGCGIIAYSDILLYLSNYNLYRSLTNISIESYSEGYIPFNEYQDYVRSNYLYFVENSFLHIRFTNSSQYCKLFNKCFKDKNVNLSAKTVSLNDKALEQIAASIEKNRPVFLAIDKITNPIVYNYKIIKYSNDIIKPYKICDGLKANDDFKGHAVVITGVIIDSVQDKNLIEVSSWGMRFVIDMDNLVDEAHISVGSDAIIIS